ncbi:MAG TPA: gamma-glutamyltransferase, partial [Rhodospirillales bacterium]|nr:gamma-glutamyltransferase [Rhodospirillales bacterium]
MKISFLSLALLFALGACGTPPKPAPVAETPAPEAASTVAKSATVATPAPMRRVVVAEKWMIATANPLAAEAGRRILRRGGSAIDATIAAQMVLNLVEPQSSGIGGGAFLLHYNQKSGEIAAYDGRETAPAKATPDMFLGDDGKPRKFFAAVVGGLSVGVPGTLRMLEMAHRENGKLPWKD